VSLTGPSPRTVAITNERGEFAFKNLPLGLYETRFELAGFATVISNVSVRSGRTERLSIKMQATPSAEPRSVNDAAQMQRESGAIGGVVGGIPMAAPMSIGSGIGGGRYFPGPVMDPFHTEAYDHFDDNTFRRVANDPLSTFSIDVDTASYANVRRFLNQGTFPPAGRAHGRVD
jgi:Ca-activated chloride channel family protein